MIYFALPEALFVSLSTKFSCWGVFVGGGAVRGGVVAARFG